MASPRWSSVPWPCTDQATGANGTTTGSIGYGSSIQSSSRGTEEVRSTGCSPGDLARATRIVAEDGVAGEAYNVAERDTAWLDRTVELAAETLETSIDIGHASERELARGGLSPFDFPLYMPIPHVAASAKLAALGWESTPLEVTFAETIENHLTSGRTGASPPCHEFGVERQAEERLIDSLAG